MMQQSRKVRVGVLFGGLSSEREVSLNSGRNVVDNLDPGRYEGVPLFVDGRAHLWVLPWQLISQNTTVDITERLETDAERLAYEALRDRIDFAFISLHGKFGEDGCIQGLLELLGIPYTGPGVLASALGMDKHFQQEILRSAGIEVPRSLLIAEEEWSTDAAAVYRLVADRFELPVVTKPTREGSSMGVTIIRRKEELEAGLQAAFRWDRLVLVEEYLSGMEFSCIVIEEEGRVLPLDVTEIHPQSGYYTYDDKYMPGRCRKFTPPKHIPPEAVDKIRRQAAETFRALRFRSYGRIDGFYLPEGRILITDPNSASGMAPSSFFFEQAACAGMVPTMILSRLIDNALVIHAGKRGPL